MATLTTGAVIGLVLLIGGGIWRITEDDHTIRELKEENTTLKRKVDDLENGRNSFEKVANRLDEKLESLARKINDKM